MCIAVLILLFKNRNKLMNETKTLEQNNSIPPFLLCVILDLLGMVSFSIPFIGEFADVVWAPLSALIYFKLFGGRMGFFGGAFRNFRFRLLTRNPKENYKKY